MRRYRIRRAFLAQTPPVKSHVLSLGIDPTALDPIALAGGTSLATPVATRGALEDTLWDLLDSTCEFSVENGPPDDKEMRVYIDNFPVPRDAKEGWTYDSTLQRVTIHGARCHHLHAIDVVHGCWGPPTG